MIQLNETRITISQEDATGRIMSVKKTDKGFRFREECDKYFELNLPPEQAEWHILQVAEYVKSGTIKAVNNHDALVEALSAIREYNKTIGSDMFGIAKYCPYCDQADSHSDDCILNAAINLLDKINGE
jgi:hypothetical protein